MKGIIFDIQKFALHDGPGIRTVVFLKGCPFKCAWCCNPESIDPEPQLSFEEQKCTHCLNCILSCETGALKSYNGKLDLDFDLCNACGKCIAECPKGALKIFGYEADSDTILEEVLKDRAYYNNSGGGLTLSGGDPLFQFNFAFEILTKAKEKGLNTCVETEGSGKPDQFEKLIPLVDYFYFDYKITDPFFHKKYTGASNENVLQNLHLLGSMGANITLRCVIVPGINDNDEHFKTIAELSAKYQTIQGVEVMAYHDFGSGKYKQIGKQAYPIESKSVSSEIADQWVTRIREFGCKNVKRG